MQQQQQGQLIDLNGGARDTLGSERTPGVSGGEAVDVDLVPSGKQ